ncbi:uncharacterized protein LOC125004147 [Mugil cephalus]|uniref:uncharacterized protein LOC125004147 n=1 Tax=Mugil cephalus TaxID=48193 RepID=UPI001FB73E7F|nr:uncharacterized protein LOC125004147 [Mugil cephalus]
MEAPKTSTSGTAQKIRDNFAVTKVSSTSLWCKTVLTQGRFGWRHKTVLLKVAETIEVRRLEVNHASPPTSHLSIQFVTQERTAFSSTVRERSLLTPGGDWALRADLDQHLKFPQEIAITSLRPDMEIQSITMKTVIMTELIVLWEDGLEAAFERKKERCAELAVAFIQAGWRSHALLRLVAGGFTATSIQQFLKTLGIRGAKLEKILKTLAEQGRF